MIETKYGKLSNNDIVLYFYRLINKIYKLMPLKENKDRNYEKYLQKLIKQLTGGDSLIISDSLFIEIIFNLESLSEIDDIELHNSIVKENISICQSVIKKMNGGR